MEMTVIPEIKIDAAMTNPDAKALAQSDDTATALLQVAKEMGVSVDGNGNVVTQPEKAIEPNIQTQAVTQPEAKTEPPVEVPAKFQNPDGSVNVEKVEKSTANVEAMIQKYRAKEKEAQTLQNKVNNPPPTAIQPLAQPQQVQPSQQIPLSPLEVQVARDLIAEYAAQGIQLPEGQAIAQARVQVRIQEARYNAELNATAELRQKVEDFERAKELESQLNSDPWLLTDEAVNALWQIRQDNPWVNKSPTPWASAYELYKGRNGHASQVKTPNPTGQAARAPAPPVSPAARVQKSVAMDKKSLNEMPLDELEALVKKSNPGYRGR